MALDKRNRFLLKTQEDGRRIIFIWKPGIAQKKGMRPISYEEAIQIQQELAAEVEAKRAEGFGQINIEDDNPVLAEAPTPLTEEEQSRTDRARNLIRTNDDLLNAELEKVTNYTQMDQLEEYFLLKYRVELPACPDLVNMKKEAIHTLTQLANSNKLYEVVK